jgi:hypothetical protein
MKNQALALALASEKKIAVVIYIYIYIYVVKNINQGQGGMALVENKLFAKHTTLCKTNHSIEKINIGPSCPDQYLGKKSRWWLSVVKAGPGLGKKSRWLSVVKAGPGLFRKRKEKWPLDVHKKDKMAECLFICCTCKTNLFQLLQVETTANDREIKKAFNMFALQHHPDKVPIFDVL